MTPPEIASVIGVLIIGLGLIATWVRNGKSQTKDRASMEQKFTSEIGYIKEKLDDENTGLGAIKNGIDEQKVHCASITGDYGARIKNLEGERDKQGGQ